MRYQDQDRDRWEALGGYDRRLPLVVEDWSPSTEEYDVESTRQEYVARGISRCGVSVPSSER